MKNYILSLFAAVLLASCSSLQVKSDYDSNADFRSYKSFYIRTDDLNVNDIDEQRIVSEIANQLKLKGMTEISSGSEDITINVSATYKKINEITAYTPNIGYGWGRWGGWRFGVDVSTTNYTETSYNQGTLILDFVDVKTNKLVWQGIGSGINVDSPKSKQKEIPQIIVQILENYPPGVKK